MDLDGIAAHVADQERKNRPCVTLSTPDARELVDICLKARGASGFLPPETYMVAALNSIAGSSD